MIKIYDTMTRSLRDFVPLTENTVNMYVCGPTVYNYIHIGNARSTVAFDTIRRYFEYRGYTVNYISNFTDVDDKIIKAANEVGISTKELSDKFITAFMEDTAQLGIKPATQNPRVINYMDEIIAFVSILIDKGFAYVSEGDVYFRVTKSNNYAKLANKTLEDLKLVLADVRMLRQIVRKILWILPFGKLPKKERFLGKVLGDLDVQAGTSNVLLWQLKSLGILSISMVEVWTLSSHTILMKSHNQKPRLVRPLLITGCITVLSMWTMRKCQNPWVTL